LQRPLLAPVATSCRSFTILQSHSSMMQRKTSHETPLLDVRIGSLQRNDLMLTSLRSRSPVVVINLQRRWLSEQQNSTKGDKGNPTPEKAEGEVAEEQGGLRGALRRVSAFNTGDLVSIYGIVLLILVIVFTPFVARYVRLHQW
jgi:hypothetical protein